MSGIKSRVAAANAAVEQDLDEYSDELDEAEDGDNTELDISGRLNQPQSHNRSLLELYRGLPPAEELTLRACQGRAIHEHQP